MHHEFPWKCFKSFTQKRLVELRFNCFLFPLPRESLQVHLFWGSLWIEIYSKERGANWKYLKASVRKTIFVKSMDKQEVSGEKTNWDAVLCSLSLCLQPPPERVNVNVNEWFRSLCSVWHFNFVSVSTLAAGSLVKRFSSFWLSGSLLCYFELSLIKTSLS